METPPARNAMSKHPDKESLDTAIDKERRILLAAAGAGVLAATFGGPAFAGTAKTLRWGIVGTGGIANSMAPRIKQADHAALAAVSSRRMESAQAFADQYGMG